MIGKVNFGGLYTTFGGQTPKDTQGGQNTQAQQNEQKQALINKNYNEIFSTKWHTKRQAEHLQAL